MIETLLVANRGEIAVRIMRTCRRLGIRTIAVYSDADVKTSHVAEADAAYRIGPPPATESYLHAEAILSAARQSGARGIHPGYGFLAENPDFAQAVMDAGLVWVGPPVRAMRALGDKARAKMLAEQHGVPLLAGYHGPDQSPHSLAEHADRIGYPVLIKAAAGGGGRGMRVVESAPDFASALEAAQREALASFGDDRVLLERYVRRPRHVEVQIFGDSLGNLIHLGERECSIQRRYQKLIEESPSPAVDSGLRARMTDAALRLGRAASYANAGTVEFLLDEHGEFAFLEVNARLQVEHPVTEAVTGLDLVELQLRVAVGEALPMAQADVRFSGHAVEVRVIAENPLAGFLPSSGVVESFDAPPELRVDTWLKDGSQISPHYDSLLAKVIAHATDRPTAVRALSDGLQKMWIEGVANNVDLLLATMDEPAFQSGDLHTGFLEEHRVLEGLAEVPPVVMAAVSALDALSVTELQDPWRMQTGWRLGRLNAPARWDRAGRTHAATVTADPAGDGVEVDTGAERPRVRLLSQTRVSVDGQALGVRDRHGRRVVEWQGRTYRFTRTAPLRVEAAVGEGGAPAGGGRLTAPMPARVVKIAVNRGQRIEQNQPLMVLEAMKMEHIIQAPHAGLVADICVQLGDQVSAGAQLLTLDSFDEPDAPRSEPAVE